MASHDNNEHQTTKNKRFLQSLHHALDGIRVAFCEESNLRRDAVFTLIVVIAGIIFQVTRFDWVMLILAISLVVISEMWNTVIENIMDFVTKRHYFPHAKKIKDMSAGTVLLAAFFAVVVGLYVFVPRLVALIR
ncbi:MAG: diacylglycerol kinase family protein [Candidatus Paralactobacillus gallistercoris]|uniref:Diacylglycerol kinase family protein n=1 Tax=Candidatus Paralactobacillus gallistercoris TaxID=2838724 RepID=A0A948X0K1_9LACO|nr:diacylglycerol kinase family protein [Candidatus Paralactobacillus gallistercoris]